MNSSSSLNMPDYVSLEEIRKTSLRLAFTQNDIEMLVRHIKRNRSKNLLTGIHPIMHGELDDWLQEGILAVALDDLETSILYVKLNAGKGIFGRQKSAYGTYIGSVSENTLAPGTIFKNWPVAITAMNNIYRSEGLL